MPYIARKATPIIAGTVGYTGTLTTDKLGGSVVDLAKHIDNELEAVSTAMRATEAPQIFHAPPPKPRPGTQVYADGTNWNPGSGEGPYYLDNSNTWQSMKQLASGISDAPSDATTYGRKNATWVHVLNLADGGTIAGNVTLNGTVTVGGTSTFNNAATFNGVLTATSTTNLNGATTFGNTATFNGAASFTNTATFGAAATFNSTAGFNSTVTFASTAPATFNGTATFANTATFNAGVSLGAAGTLTTASGNVATFNGTATFNNTATFTGSASFATLTTSSTTTINGAATFSNTATFNGAFSATSTAGFSGAVSVTGTITVPTPTLGAQATNKTYVDGAIASAIAGAGVVFPGVIFGLIMSTAGASTTLTVAAGQAADSTAATYMQLASAMAKTTAAWAQGTGNGGLDTGSIANNTWYHWFLIEKTDKSAVDVLFSTSLTPTMPSTWSFFRRIGSMKTNASGQWTAFFQNNDTFLWSTLPPLDYNQANPGASAVTVTLSTPPGVKVEALLHTDLFTGTPAGAWMLSSLDIADIAPAAGNTAPLATIVLESSSQVGAPVRVWTNTSNQIRSRYNVAVGAAHVLSIQTMGWIDGRGRLS